MDALFFQTGHRFLGRRLEAVELSRKLLERAADLPPVRNHWYSHLLDYNSDQLSAQALLELAGPSRWNRSEAHFHIGLNRLAEGDRTGAREHFRETISKGAFNSFDFDWSRAFLARMERDPNWPPWIPTKSEP